MSIVGAEVNGAMAAALPIHARVGHGRDTFVKVGHNDWRRDVGEGHVSSHPIYDNQMVGTTVRSVPDA